VRCPYHNDRIELTAALLDHYRQPNVGVAAGHQHPIDPDRPHHDQALPERLGRVTAPLALRQYAVPDVPAAVNEREVAEDLLQAGPPPRDLLCDKGFNGKAFAAAQAARGTSVLIPPGKAQRASMPAMLLKVIAQWRNRVETSFGEITGQMELARHGAHSFWGLLTRTAATIAAHTLLRTCLAGT
jgi:hypothetical protein